MSFLRALRWSTGWLFIPLIAAATYAGSVAQREFFGDYPLVALSQAAVSLVVVAPVFAGWAAWDAARARPWLDATFGGAHRGKALGRLIVPGVVSALVVGLLVLVDVTGSPRGQIAAMLALALLLTQATAAAFGAAIGSLASGLVAVPIAVGSTYAAAALAVADPSSFLGRTVVTGIASPCCDNTQQISATDLTLCLTVCVVLLAGSLRACMAQPEAPGRLLTLAASLAVALLLAAIGQTFVVKEGQLTARVTHTPCQRLQGLQICVWPEHRHQLSQAAAGITQVRQAADSLGIHLPDAWSEDPRADVMTFTWRNQATADQLRYALAISVSQGVGCAATDYERPLAAALTQKMDPNADVGDLTQDAEISDLLTTLRGMSATEQAQWARQTIRACHA